MALSTTHVATGSISVARRQAGRRGARSGRPHGAGLVGHSARRAGIVGALSFWLSHGVEAPTGAALAGDGLIFLILVGLSFYMWWRAQQQKVDHKNVNADWDASTNSVVPAEVREATKGSTDKAAVWIATGRPDKDSGITDDLSESIFMFSWSG